MVGMSEGSSITNSGKEGISDRYINSLYYIDELSSLSEIGIKMNFRQALIGGYYSLLYKDNNDIVTPTSDYYLLYLYKKMVSNKIFSSYSDDENVRVYGECSKEYSGGIVIVVVNLYDSKSVEINSYDSNKIDLERNRYEYKISSFFSTLSIFFFFPIQFLFLLFNLF